MLANEIEVTLPSPIISVETRLTKEKNIKLSIKRDDLIHPLVSGNKWRKLKYNLTEIKANGSDMIFTFGGAFSNHIHALAAACHHLKIPCTAFIRGEIDLNNPTLIFCKSKGMNLIGMSREGYRLKEKAQEIQTTLEKYKNATIIPEGGSNPLAMYGVAEIIDEIAMESKIVPDYITLACGTGCTAAGLLTSSSLKSNIIAFSALKSEHLYDEILTMAGRQNIDMLKVCTQYHFGGYAKSNSQLLDFMDEFTLETGVPLDHVYNGKALFGLMDLIAYDYFPPDTKILHLHTGGLQGKAGLAYMNGK